MKPILLYNCETWGLSETEQTLIDAFHRQQLRKVLKINYPYKISKKHPNERCDSSQVSLEVTRRRWNALGPILCLSKTTPCWRSMIHYFNQEELKKFRKRTRTTLVTTINEDIKLFEGTNQEAAAILKIAPLETLTPVSPRSNRSRKKVLEGHHERYPYCCPSDSVIEIQLSCVRAYLT